MSHVCRILLLVFLHGVACTSIYEEAQQLLPYLKETRRALHQIPELLFELDKTSAFVRKQLDAIGIDYDFPVARSGIVARLGTGNGPKFALRTDMDALPITEEVESDFKSQHPGKMHACGHDSHMTMLLGAAKILKAREADIKGTVVIIFQPAEEGGGGGKMMVDEGVLNGVSGVFGMHVWPLYPSGVAAIRAGTMMAASDKFEAIIYGQGGHGAMPHLTADPVVAGAQAVLALQPLISRELNPTDSGVVTVARFSTGEGASNVIPERVQLNGTTRALTKETAAHIKQRVIEVIKGAAALHLSSAEVKFAEVPYLPTINDPKLARAVSRVARQLLHETHPDAVEADNKVWDLPPPTATMGAEDFSFLADAVPGAFMFLGIQNEAGGSTHGLHTPQFQLDEEVMPFGAAMHASIALDALSEQNVSSQGKAHSEL